MNNNYPIGAEQDARAPWNQDSSFEVEEVDVWASNTLSKNDQLEIEKGKYDSSNLKKEWFYQKKSAKQALEMANHFAKEIYIATPEDFIDKLHLYRAEAVRVFNACEGWEEDEFEVTLE